MKDTATDPSAIFEETTIEENQVIELNSTRDAGNGSLVTDTCGIATIPMAELQTGLSAVGCILNMLMVGAIALVLKKRRVTQKATYYCLFNMALSDTAWTLLQMVSAVHVITDTYFLIPYCIFQDWVTTFRVAPGYFLLVKTIDCYVYIVHGLTYHFTMSTCKSRVIITFTWFFSIAVTSAPSMIMYAISSDCRSSEKLLHQKWYHITTFVITLLPLVIIFILYAVIFFHIVRLLKRQETMAGKSKRNRNPKRQSSFFAKLSKTCVLDAPPAVINSLKATLIVCLTFCITWLPQTAWSIVIFAITSGTYNCSISYLYILSLMMALVNPILDPFMYMWGYHDLRQTILGMWAKKQRVSGTRSEAKTSTMQTAM